MILHVIPVVGGGVSSPGSGPGLGTKVRQFNSFWM
jgi:hypothetical protein